MARTSVRFSRPARLGLMALVIIALASAAVYFGLGARGTGGYRMGVRFRTAAGIAPGAQVFFNGVNIGTVSKVEILPDTSVEIILNILHATDIPKNARFSIQSTFTGSQNINIVLPKQRVAQNRFPTPLPQSELLPKRILPVAEQPVGTTPLSIEDVMAQGKALGSRASRVLGMARPYGSKLSTHLQNARTNGLATTQEMRAAFPALMASLQSTIASAKANAAAAEVALRERDRPKLAAIAAAFKRSASDMNKAVSVLGTLKSDPTARRNIRVSTEQVRAATSNLARLSNDMETLAKNAQTKAQLRDAGQRFHAILTRLKSLMP